MSGRGRVLFLNGRFVSAANARVSPLDRGLLFGDGIFETIRTYGGQPFALGEHLDRLRSAARHVRLPVRQSDSWWRGVIIEVLRRDCLTARDAAVRLTITRGVGGGSLVLPRRPKPTVLVYARALPRRIAELQRSGVGVVLLPFHPGLGGYLSNVKTTDYLTAALGKSYAEARDAFEGLYVTANGHILEGTTSNLFVVRGGILQTPPVGNDVLPGVTRGKVLSLARSYGFAVRERPISRAALLEADEAFLTATTIEVLPIRYVDEQEIGGRKFPQTRILQKLFRAHREAEIRSARN